MDATVSVATLVNVLFLGLIINILILALAFSIVSASAFLLERPNLATIFGPASGFLTGVAALFSALRSLITDLLADVISE